LFVLLGLYYWFYKKNRKPEIIILPHEKAFDSLNKLRKITLENVNDYKIFYFELSDILRRYLKERFDILALEKIGQDFFEEIDKIQEIEKQDKESLISFVNKTDFYKYAVPELDKSQAENLLDNVNTFIDKTKKVDENINKERKIVK
jgi:flagellar biosynthesis component FlhA